MFVLFETLSHSVKHDKLSEEYNQLFTDFDELSRKFEEQRERGGLVEGEFEEKGREEIIMEKEMLEVT